EHARPSFLVAMSTAPCPRVGPRWYGVGLADLVLLFFSAAIVQVGQARMVDDPSLGWQLRIPDAMWEAGGFLHADPFSGPAAGRPWVPYGFVASGLFWLANEWGGLAGL